MLATGAQQFSRAQDPRDPAFARDLLRDFVEAGLIDQISAERALQAQSKTRQRIDNVIAELGLLSTPKLYEAIARYCGLEFASPQDVPSEPALSDALTESYLREHCILPLTLDANGALLLAVGDPFNRDMAATVAFLVERPTVAVYLPANDIANAISRLYPSISSGGYETNALTKGDGQYVSEDDVQRLLDVASEAPIIKLVNRLITNAVLQRASDIHIEPMTDHVRVRYRIDGLLYETERLPLDLQPGLATRIKVIARLNIAERRLPQDGRTKFVVPGREIDLRVATTPVLHGESLVLRILDKASLNLTFTALGLDTNAIQTIVRLINRPNGIVLVTGPTGSGKTTTLYAAMTLLNATHRKIFSVEDPIEYELSGINQGQIKPAIGLDFPQFLRSILRQDPDIIMIGEMRDTDTARIGVQASLTGHLVLSTLHTNSAAASVTRLLDMGVEDFLLASTLSGVVAQRLVRKLCLSCSEPDRDHQTKDRLRTAIASANLDISAAALRKPVGCDHCNGSGFLGRTAITEILEIDDTVRRLIKTGVTEQEIATAGHKSGMESLYQNAMRKVLRGETTLDEVLLVAGL